MYKKLLNICLFFGLNFTLFPAGEELSIEQAFLSACQNGTPETLQELTTNQPRLLRNYIGNTTGLIEAARSGNTIAVNYLLQNGAINSKALPLAQNSKIKRDKTSGYGPLQAAAKNGHIDVIRALLDSRYIDLYDHRNGKTALHVAAKHNRSNVVNLLLKEYGMLATTKTYLGDLTPADIARNAGHDLLSNEIEEYTRSDEYKNTHARNFSSAPNLPTSSVKQPPHAGQKRITRSQSF